MVIGWVGGWGISPAELKPLAEAHAPEAQHVLLAPIAGAPEAAADCDAVVAWSLGAHRVLEGLARCAFSLKGSSHFALHRFLLR